MKKIFLHVLIPDGMEFLPIKTRSFRRFKTRLRRLADWVLWASFGRFQFRSYNYTDRAQTNRGDIAIKHAIQESLRKAVPGAAIEQTSWGELTKETIDKINVNGDLFVIAGGGYWVFDGKDRLSETFKKDFPFLMLIRKPLIAFGVGVNHNIPLGQPFRRPNPDPESRAMLHAFQNRVELISVRDDNTSVFWESLGCHKCRVIPDPAAFLTPSSAAGVLEDTGIHVGVNLAFHGKFMEPFLESNFEIYAGCLKEIVHRWKVRLHYFVHSDEELLIVKMLRHKGLMLDVIDLPAEKMLPLYGRMNAHICQMLHSNILAFNAGVPTLNLAYDSKNRAFNRLIGMEEYCIDADGLQSDLLLSRFEALMNSRKNLAERLATRKTELGNIYNSFLGQITALAARVHSAEAAGA